MLVGSTSSSRDRRDLGIKTDYLALLIVVERPPCKQTAHQSYRMRQAIFQQRYVSVEAISLRNGCVQRKTSRFSSCYFQAFQLWDFTIPLVLLYLFPASFLPAALLLFFNTLYAQAIPCLHVLLTTRIGLAFYLVPCLVNGLILLTGSRVRVYKLRIALRVC